MPWRLEYFEVDLDENHWKQSQTSFDHQKCTECQKMLLRKLPEAKPDDCEPSERSQNGITCLEIELDENCQRQSEIILPIKPLTEWLRMPRN